tara:strand:+ start:457 stop:750 length:294 start_codon:yes stop_codon:yes gene_type:complete
VYLIKPKKIDMNTQENNKLISDFMGDYNFEHTEGGLPIGDFSNSWDWLMPVSKKIENRLWNVGKVGYFDECLSSNDLEVRYQAVVEFINQYNKNKEI